MNRATTLLTLALALAVTGCRDPYTSDRAEPTRTKTAVSARADSAASGPAAPPLSGAVARTLRRAGDVARSFATRWINWDWQTAAGQQRALAQLATAELARTLRANARSARIDATLERDKPASRGTVAAIQLNTAGATATGIVVTREQTYTSGHADLGGQRYRVYLVKLHRKRHGWAVSAWEPQP